MQDELPIFVKWMEFLNWFTAITEGFPKNLRWSLTSRLENHAYDILEQIIQAQYEPKGQRKRELLREINLKIDFLRVLLRHAHERRILSAKAYERSIRALHEAGSMAGGWIKKVDQI